MDTDRESDFDCVLSDDMLLEPSVDFGRTKDAGCREESLTVHSV